MKFLVKWAEDTVESWESVIEANSMEDAEAMTDKGDHYDGADMKESAAITNYDLTIRELKNE